MNQPGAAEIRAELTSGLVERSLARAVRLVFNQGQTQVAQVQQRGTQPQAVLPAAGAPSVQRQKQKLSVRQTATTG